MHYFDLPDDNPLDPWEIENKLENYKKRKKKADWHQQFLDLRPGPKKKKRHSKGVKKRASRIIEMLRNSGFPLSEKNFEKLRESIKTMKGGQLD